MRWSEIPAGVSERGLSNFRDALGGVGGEIIGLMAEERGFAMDVAAFTLARYQSTLVEHRDRCSAAWRRASAVLGRNFIHPDKAEEAWGIKYDRKTLSYLVDVLPGDHVLCALARHDYLVVPGPNQDLDFLQLYNLKPYVFNSGSFSYIAKQNEVTNSKDLVGRGWLAISKRPLLANCEEQFFGDRASGANVCQLSWCIVVADQCNDLDITGGKTSIARRFQNGLTPEVFSVRKVPGSGIIVDDTDLTAAGSGVNYLVRYNKAR